MKLLSVWHGRFVGFRNKRRARQFQGAAENLVYYPEDSVFTYRTIWMGNDVFINRRAYFSGRIHIGNHVLFGPDVFITSGDHCFTEIGKYIHKQGRVVPREVNICDDVWVGAKTCILAGVTIGEGTVVGAGSVVTKDLPPYSICVGNPCRKIKDRYPPGALAGHLILLGKESDDAVPDIGI